MKNFLIIVLALGLTAAAFATRPDREDFDRYLAKKLTADSTVATSLQPIAIFRKTANSTAPTTANAVMTSAVGTAATASPEQEVPVVIDPAKVEFQDFLLWTVVKQDGKTLFTGVFDHWIDNQQVRGMLPS
jgi:hypothetical protein